MRSGSWSEQLLRSMYLVTRRFGGALPGEVERLWAAVAVAKRNVIPVLDFLITRATQEDYPEVQPSSPSPRLLLSKVNYKVATLVSLS